MKYEVEIYFGHSFLNDTGREVYGNNKKRKTIFKGEADNEEMAVVAANVEFGVEFKKSMWGVAYIYDVSDDCSLILRIS